MEPGADGADEASIFLLNHGKAIYKSDFFFLPSGKLT